ncbi:MAG: metal-dependent hydrolase [Opitutus sp.]|nr:metal-dependent hydrolase [Opitutus sp.]
MQRREFLETMLTSAALATATRSGSATVASAGKRRLAMTDTNVSLFQWPFRRLPLDRTAALLGKMDEHGFATAWAGSFEGVLQRNIGGVNERLAHECRESGGRLVPFGAINPTLPDWEEDIRRCREKFSMPGIRLHPNYHGYALQDPLFERVLRRAAERRLLVQIAVSMEDPRWQHPLMLRPDVDVTPLPAVMERVPGARVLLLNAGRIMTGAAIERLGSTPGLYFDSARVDGTGALGKLLRALPPKRLVFGTHAPFFIYEAALIRVYESNLTPAEAERLLVTNPRALLET